MSKFPFFVTSLRNKQLVCFLLLFLLCLLLNHSFEYREWNPTTMGRLTRLLYFAILVVGIVRIKTRPEQHFEKIVLFISLYPILSSFGAFYEFNQHPFDTLYQLIPHTIWFFYFFFHRLKIEEETLLKLFFAISLCIVFIQIFQNLYPESAMFGIKAEEDMQTVEDIARMRNGIYRFRMHENCYWTCPILFVLFHFLKKEFNRTNFLFVCLFLVSVYLTLTRQVMIACLLAIYCSFFINKGRNNFRTFVLGLCISLGLYYGYDILFSEFADLTQEESTIDNIRIVAATYFFNEDTKNIVTFLVGHGIPYMTGEYADHMNYLTQTMRFFNSDVGFIGFWYYYGLPWVVGCYYLLYLLYIKYKRFTPIYIRLFVLFTAIMSIMIFPMYNSTVCLIWSMLLYITDLHINDSDLRFESFTTDYHLDE